MHTKKVVFLVFLTLLIPILAITFIYEEKAKNLGELNTEIAILNVKLEQETLENTNGLDEFQKYRYSTLKSQVEALNRKINIETRYTAINSLYLLNQLKVIKHYQTNIDNLNTLKTKLISKQY